MFSPIAYPGRTRVFLTCAVAVLGAACASSKGAMLATSGGAGGGTGGTGGGSGGSGACAGALFCDDFESYGVGTAPGGPWTTQLNAGAIVVEPAPLRSGTKAVKVTTQAKDGTKTALLRLSKAPVFPLASNVLYGRMTFMLEAAPTASVHWTMIQGGGLIAGQAYHALYRYGGQLPITPSGGVAGSQLMANYETPDSYGGQGPSSDCWAHANKIAVPVGRWSCVEWRFDGPNDTMNLWLDGVPVDSLTVTGVGQGCVNQPATYPWTAPVFDRLDLGWESYQPDDPRTLWIDDVVVSSGPIGCPNAVSMP